MKKIIQQHELQLSQARQKIQEKAFQSMAASADAERLDASNKVCWMESG